jgi:hypothetical protein
VPPRDLVRVSHAERSYSRTCEPSVRETRDERRSNRERAALAVPLPSIVACARHALSPPPTTNPRSVFTETASAYDTAVLARAPRRVPGKSRLRLRARPWRDARLHACSSPPTSCSQLVAGLPAAPAASPGRPAGHACGLVALQPYVWPASPQRRDEMRLFNC